MSIFKVALNFFSAVSPLWARRSILALAVATLAVLSLPGVLTVARWTDRNLMHSLLKDSWGSFRWQENWADAEPVPVGLDETWMKQKRPWRIAHALGAGNASNRNSLTALDTSIAAGFRLFEVDIWLDAGGNLRCHHGPTAPPPVRPGDCTLSPLLSKVSAGNGWLVLDIKTDFALTGAAIVALLKQNGLGRLVIFQLYRPSDFASFSRWTSIVPLAEPIVTAYSAHRSVQHIADHLAHLRVKAFTVPIEAMSALNLATLTVPMLVHPVNDCEANETAQLAHVAGLYTISSLKCSASAP